MTGQKTWLEEVRFGTGIEKQEKERKDYFSLFHL